MVGRGGNIGREGRTRHSDSRRENMKEQQGGQGKLRDMSRQERTKGTGGGGGGDDRWQLGYRED